jgi:hypothetical protein
MLTEDKITEIYCIADDFCKEFSQEFKNRRMAKSTATAPAGCPTVN